jgi:hypothetical protein
MKTKKCDVCGKEIEGFSTKDVNYRMLMHKMKHRNSDDSNNKEEEMVKDDKQTN